jgi:Rieske Fe-S protein
MIINKNKISRKKFFKTVATIVSVPLSVLWFAGTKKKVATSAKRVVTIPENLPDGITFLNDVIIKKEGNTVLALSSKCTHLGCKINSTENDKLVCPCHGSRFNFDGVPLNGPATKELNKLKIEKENSTGETVVYV